MEKISCKFIIHFFLCGALTDLVPFAQFKKREKHPWRSVTFSKVAGFNFPKSNTPPWAFFTSFKLRKWYQIAQRTTYRRYINAMSNIKVAINLKSF